MESEKGFVVVCTDRELLYLAIENMVQGTFRRERVTVDGLGVIFRRFPLDAPDSIILDCETGVSALMRRVSKALPSVPIVVWQRANAAEACLHALELGAAGVLQDNCSAADIVACLSAVQEGHVWVPPSVAQASLDFRRYRLSPREWEVMTLVSRGLCNKEIAYAMGITEGTTKVYLSRMFDKLEVSDRYELALLGLRHFSQTSASTPAKTADNLPVPESETAAERPQSVFVYRPPARLNPAIERHW